jgi:NAD(P)-dependent dehydrogenase (short-subunit alcohol dehydrogenase family)
MLMSGIARGCECVALPELAGSRVLITGLTSTCGFDVARAFADSGARIVLQSPEDSQEMVELAAVLAESSSDIRMFNDPLAGEADAARLVQSAIKEFGGIDCVVNIAAIDGVAAGRLETGEDMEATVARALCVPLHVTEVAANRMRLVWTEGSVLNIVRIHDAPGGRAMMLGDMLRALLGDLTRGLATRWSEHGIRINGIAAPTSVATISGETAASETDLAAVAVQLASGKARSVSGHVLDAAGAARRRC